MAIIGLSAHTARLESLNAEIVDELGRYRQARTKIGDLITRLIDGLDEIDAVAEDMEDFDEGDALDAGEDDPAERDDDSEANASPATPEWRPSVPAKRIGSRARP
ncbi:hypothetical protein [Hansschlegelia sp. KR7-227]|uniref:hypothetical protein n=1 Tax=Hansschlegelia sp. KR7-227 TaxID=3400914 RepID=UPI003C094E0E